MGQVDLHNEANQNWSRDTKEFYFSFLSVGQFYFHSW